MKLLLPIITTVLFVFGTTDNAISQCSGWANFNITETVYPSLAFGVATSPEADKLDRPYDYVASVAGGIRVFKRDGSIAPPVVATIPTTQLGNLYAINLFQDSIWLYAALGDIWDTTAQMAGLAIINTSDPENPLVTDVYTHPGMPLGAGAVIVRNDLAYLAANQNGLLILDVSDKSSILLKSTLPFLNNFPHAQAGSHWKFNARGIDLKDQYAYVCYDRGGLRVADISDPNNPVQVHQYCNPGLINFATAYNNVVIHDTLAYVALDYYGMEILSISNPLSISPVGWWHPTNWANATNNLFVWGAANGHANEIAYDPDCRKVYIAAGKTDAMAIDVSNPSNPVSCDSIGTVGDDYGTWGLDFYNHELHLAYIWAPVTPPFSNYTGLKIAATNCSLGLTKETPLECIISPNPVYAGEVLQLSGIKGEISIKTALGEPIYYGKTDSGLTLPVGVSGIYFVQIREENGKIRTQKIIVQ